MTDLLKAAKEAEKAYYERNEIKLSIAMAALREAIKGAGK